MSRYRRKKRFWGGPIAYVIEGLFALGILGGACYGFYRYAHDTREFQIHTMKIEGLNLVSDQAIVKASKLTQQDNLLLIRCGKVAQRIEGLPGIKQCKVERVFPDTLFIRVTERKPVATVLLRNHLYEIDDEGVVVREIASSKGHAGPYITDLGDIGMLEVGQQIKAPEMLEALKVWQAFRTTNMAKDVTVSELAAKSTNDVRMYCDQLPFELRWGRGDYKRQARRLDVLWKQEGKELDCNQYLDLRFGPLLACK